MNNNKPIVVLFVNAVNPRNHIEVKYPPLGLAYLASYTQKYLGKDKVKFQMVSDNFENTILEIKPDILGITCVSQNYNLAKNLAKFSKKLGIKHILIGGAHISLYPNSLDSNIDIGIIGEGEATFAELITLFVKKKCFNAEDLISIKGIAHWDSGNVKLTSHRKLIEPLDAIPFPDRSLFKIDKDDAYMFSSRGCPYRCIFCASSRLWKKTRFHSANYVFNEIKELVYKYDVKRINFYDDLFIADKQRIKKLVYLLKEENLDKKVQFSVLCRANLVDDEICLLLKQMNVKTIGLGLESGSPIILKYLKGNSVTVSDNFKAVKTIKRHGLSCVASFIIGAPIDTKETILETLSFIKKSEIDKFKVFCLTPFPGTPIWEYAVKNNLLPAEPSNIDWNKIDVDYSRSHNFNIHLAKNLTRDELFKLYLLFENEQKKRFVLRTIKMFFTNPTYFFVLLKERLHFMFSQK